MITHTTSPFEIWAQANGYDTAPAMAPSGIRTYADRQTQAAFEAWEASRAAALSFHMKGLAE